MNDRIPLTDPDGVLAGVKAKPFGWPTASLDPDSGHRPEAMSGTPANTNPQFQVSTVSGDCRPPPAGASQTLTAAMPECVGYGEVVHVTGNRDRRWVLVVALVDASQCLGVAVMLCLLGRGFEDAQNGRPFSDASVSRMCKVAWLSAGLGVTAFDVKPFTMVWASSRVPQGSWSVNASLVPVFLVVVAFALAAIWRRGAELAEFDGHAI